MTEIERKIMIDVAVQGAASVAIYGGYEACLHAWQKALVHGELDVRNQIRNLVIAEWRRFVRAPYDVALLAAASREARMH